MLSSFLPPVPSLPNDPPEHFPLRKTGEWDRQVEAFRGWGLEGQDMGGECGRSERAAEGRPTVLVSLTLPSLALTRR